MTSFRNLSIFIPLVLVSSFASSTHAQSLDRTALEAEIRGLIGELKTTEQQYLEPSARDKNKNAQFLAQPDTGLIRLLPRETFDGKLSIRGGGAYYSFAHLRQEYDYGTNIGFEQGQLSVGFAGADFGFLTRLGKTDLGDITLAHPAAQYLANFTTPNLEPDAREQQRRSGTGFEANGFAYKSYLPMKLKNTYLVRSVSYDDSDILVAFRVVSQDTDGSVDILWKILKRFPVTHLVSAPTAASR